MFNCGGQKDGHASQYGGSGHYWAFPCPSPVDWRQEKTSDRRLDGNLMDRRHRVQRLDKPWTHCIFDLERKLCSQHLNLLRLARGKSRNHSHTKALLLYNNQIDITAITAKHLEKKTKLPQQSKIYNHAFFSVG